jgi:hypothetical protein
VLHAPRFHDTRLAGLELLEAAHWHTAQSGECEHCVQEVGGLLRLHLSYVRLRKSVYKVGENKL